MPKVFHLDTSSKILKVTDGGKLVGLVNIANISGVSLSGGRNTKSITFSGVGSFSVNAADTYAEDSEEAETATAANILTAVLAQLLTGERTISERSAEPEKPEAKDESKAKSKTKAKEEPKEEVKEPKGEANQNVSTEAPVL